MSNTQTSVLFILKSAS